jgi:hypothetical protein
MVFSSLVGKRQYQTVFLGAPEAEAEAMATSRMPLVDVYEDFHQLLDGLSGEKFIVIGRKGAGKSAFAEYVYARSLSEPNLSCEFVRKNDCDLERAIQLGQEAELNVDTESFFRWVIYTNILRLFVDHPAVEGNNDYQLLRLFLDKNSGYIRINELELKQLISKHGFDVAIEQFRRFLSVKLNKQIEIKSERAPYFKLLGHLEEVIIRLLKTHENQINENSFVLFFDDLDIGFDASSDASINSLVSLLRACRHVNNDVFGKNRLNAKAVILLRDDIEAWVSGRFADTAKLFASYASRINWYQEEFSGQGKDENSLNLKRFINKRICYALGAAQLPCGTDPWASLVAEEGYEKTGFKYVVNQTLFRPRDLLLFFLPLDTGKFSYPLSPNDVRVLADRYSEELAKEVKSELSSFYKAAVIEMIFKALGQISETYQTYDDASQIIRETSTGVDANELLAYLFDRSRIGMIDSKGWFTFKCRQSVHSSAPLNIDTNQKLVVQYGIRVYLKTRRYV